MRLKQKLQRHRITLGLTSGWICPKAVDGALMSLTGNRKFVWFSTLNNSLRNSGAVPWSETSLESNTVKGVPLMAVTIPFNCQLPNRSPDATRHQTLALCEEISQRS